MESINFERYNPFRRPDWRFERVLKMVDRHPTPGRSTKKDDEYVRGLRNFILRYRQYTEEQRERLCYENPGLYFAWLIHDRASDDQDWEMAFMVQSRILARQTDMEIAIEVDTIPETIRWYEHLFFDVRSRLRARDWITKHVLVPAIVQSQENAHDPDVRFPRMPLAEPFYDATLKFFAYFGGSVILDFMVTGFKHGMMARSQEDIEDWLTEYVTQAMFRRTAMAVTQLEVNKYNVMELIALHTRLVEIKKQADLEGTTRNELERNIEGLLADMPWGVGAEGAANFDGSIVQELDEHAAELRDHELMLHASDRKLLESDTTKLGEIKAITMPAPRRKEADEKKEKDSEDKDSLSGA